MKKTIALLLTSLMLLSFSACGKKGQGNEKDDSIKETVSSSEKETEKETEKVTVAETEEKEENNNNASGKGPDYWAELYGQNRCSFSIMCSDTEKNYYFKNGGYINYWIYTSDNTDGWYRYKDYIISADNKFAIDPEEASNSFSSFCSFEAKPYDGETLTAEQQKEQLNGVFYVLNPYTPISTNWGIGFVSESDRTSDDVPDLSVYDLTSSLRDQEWFDMYIKWYPQDYPEFDGDAVDLWAFPHRDKSEYPETLSDDWKELSANIGCFDYEEELNLAHIRTFIPNKDADGPDADRIDIVMTYAGDVVVGLVSVDITKES